VTKLSTDLNTDSTTPGRGARDPFLLRTLEQIGLLLAFSGLALTIYFFFLTPFPLDALPAALITLFAATGWGLIKLGYMRYTAHLVIVGVMTAATASALSFGSVRAAGVLMFLGAVAGAGIFTGRKALIATVIVAISIIFALVFAEWQGWLVPRNARSGAPALVTYIVTILVVALMVYYSRNRTDQTLSELTTELDNRRRTEQERDRSMERFARFFRTSPSPMVVQSARNGMILDVNPAFERCYGYTREQTLGRDDAFLWADVVHRRSYLELLVEHRAVYHFAVQALRADGSSFSALISSELGNDPEDKLVITTVTDVSAQAETLERLRRSEERFAKAFNFSPLNMTITRLADGAFIEVNRTDDSVQGFSSTDLQGRTSVETGSWLRPEDRDVFVARLQKEGRINGYETRMRHKDGRLVDARLWAVVIDIDGEDCILSCTVNTTEEKQRETLLVNLAQGMDGLTGEALFGSLTRHLAQALGAEMTGLAELGDDGRLHTIAVYADGQPAPNYSYALPGTPCEQTLLQRGLCVYSSGLQERFPSADLLSEAGFESYVGQALLDDTGQPIGVMHALWRRPVEPNANVWPMVAILASRATAELIRLQRDREIHNLNATLEQRVRARTAQLEQLNAELDSFAYSVSHDLKSPLRAIDGFTRLLGDLMGDRLQPDERALFDRVLASTQRMSALIADLLALARVSQGTLALAHTDLSEMAEQVLQAEQQRHPARTLRWRIEPGLVGQCDARLVRVVLDNLLGNAVKYTRDQPSPLIEVGRVADHPGELFVRDNGVGFNMAYADKLFKPFQRLHMPSEFEGTGIGLATVRRIVERHGGRISGTSRQGQGAEFRFTLAPSSTPQSPDALPP
jgi:PAS domain S-box-containing protein